MLVSSIDYNDFVGRIAIGRIERGTIQQNQEAYPIPPVLLGGR